MVEDVEAVLDPLNGEAELNHEPKLLLPYSSRTCQVRDAGGLIVSILTPFTKAAKARAKS